MSEEKKTVELKEEELEKISGGSYSQNEDGSYNINYGEGFKHGFCTYVVKQDVRNAWLWTTVYCDYYEEDSKGKLLQDNQWYYSVKEILFGK